VFSFQIPILEDPAICIFAAEEYGNEDRNWGSKKQSKKLLL